MGIEWPRLAILIVTYDRPKEIRATIRALRQHVQYAGEIDWFVCDDGSPGTYVQDLQKDFAKLGLRVSTTQREGWGANVNKGLMGVQARHDYIFSCEDDYVLMRPINLTAGIALMHAETSIGLVRYDGLSGHHLNLELREASTPYGGLSYLNIRKDSPSLNVYSNRPHLKHKRFHKFYGMYPVGLPLGRTEEIFAHTVKDQSEGPKLACLWDGIPRAFDHIGTSRQGTALDKESSRAT